MTALGDCPSRADPDSSAFAAMMPIVLIFNFNGLQDEVYLSLGRVGWARVGRNAWPLAVSSVATWFRQSQTRHNGRKSEMYTGPMPPTQQKDDVLSAHQDFSVLSLADLLLARDKNHVDLMRRQNVVGTAVGYYLIRHKDRWPKTTHEHKRQHPVRTLGNSSVRADSWPCILVFVKQWAAEEDLAWTDRVPPALYLEDNRKVPVCVVEAPLQERIDTTVVSPMFPTSRI